MGYKAIIAAISVTLLVGGGSTGAYFGIKSNQENKDPVLRNKEQNPNTTLGNKNIPSDNDVIPPAKTKEPINDGPSSSPGIINELVKKNNFRIKEVGKNKFYKYNYGDLYTNKEEKQTVKKDLSIIATRKANTIKAVKKYYYELYARKNGNLRPLSYEGFRYTDPKYSLSNVLALNINKDVKTREDIALFADFIKENMIAKNWLYLNYETVDAFRTPYSQMSSSCFDYANMITSKNPWKRLMGQTHYTINCSSDDHFKDYSITDHITRFLGLGKRQVTILYPGQTIRKKNTIYMTLDDAKRISKLDNIDYGDTIVLPSDIGNWGADFNVNKLRTLEKMLDSSKGSSYSEIIDGLWKNDPIKKRKDSAIYIASLVHSFFTLIRNEKFHSSTNSEAYVNEDNIVSLLSKSIINSLKSKIQETLFNDNAFLSFLITNGKKEGIKMVSRLLSKVDPKINKYRATISKNRDSVKIINEQIKRLEVRNKNNFVSNEIREKFRLLNEEVSSLEIDLKNIEKDLRIMIIMDKELKAKTILNDADRIRLKNFEYGINTLGIIRTKGLKLLEKERKKRDDFDEQHGITLFNKRTAEIIKLLKDKECFEKIIDDHKKLIEAISMKKNDLAKIQKKINSMHNNSDVARYFKQMSLSDSLNVFSILFKASMNNTFADLGIATKGKNGEYSIDFDGLKKGDKKIIYKLFTEKEAVRKLNIFIKYLNGLGKNTSSIVIESIARLLNVYIPRDFYDFLNTTIKIGGSTITPKNGIEIKNYEIYGKYVGAITSSTATAGGITGFIIGALKIGGRKGGILGAGIGLLIAGITSGVTTGILTHQNYGDGNLNIHALSPLIMSTLDKLSGKSLKSRKFNLFEHGLNILRNNFDTQLNRLFTDIGSIFTKNDKKIQNALSEFNSKFKHQKLSGVKIIGKIFENVVLSLRFWNLLLDRNNYETLPFSDRRVMKSNIKRQIINEIKLEKIKWQEFTGSSNQNYLNRLLEFQNLIVNRLIDISFPQLTIPKSNEVKKIVKLGYNPDVISRDKVRGLGDLYLRTTNANTIFQYIDLKQSPNSHVDAAFVFRFMTQNDLKFLWSHPIEQRMKERQNEEISIPLMKSDIVIVTSVLNKTYYNITRKAIHSLM